MRRPTSIAASCCMSSKQWAAALASYAQAIAVKPDFAGAYYNSGIVLRELRQFEAALASYDRAIAIKPDYCRSLPESRQCALRPAAISGGAGQLRSSHLDQARLRRGIHEPGESISRLEAVRVCFCKLRPGSCIEAELQISAGSAPARADAGLRLDGFRCRCGQPPGGIERQELVSQPFPLLALLESGPLHRQAAEPMFGRNARRATRCRRMRASQAARIRIGYFSADFRDHPVATLAAELFETHHRSKFETTAFSFGPDTQDTHEAAHGACVRSLYRRARLLQRGHRLACKAPRDRHRRGPHGVHGTMPAAKFALRRRRYRSISWAIPAPWAHPTWTT